jgi:selenide,water dikinase
LTKRQQQLICDPQTSGGLLVALDPVGEADFLALARAAGMTLQPIGVLRAPELGQPLISIRE